jgi:pyrimidine operon attenuation protein/uracil phosphoribosyltransferase
MSDRPAERLLMDAADLDAALGRLVAGLLERFPDGKGLVLVGIRTRGEFLARRLQAALERRLAVRIPVGVLDVTIHRDDFDALQEAIRVRGSQIDFDLAGRHVVLVDDVLFTGRSARAAMDALIDRSRPGSISLAVLVDRGHRELPIEANFVGRQVETSRAERVRVQLSEVDGVDRVIVLAAGDRRATG